MYCDTFIYQGKYSHLDHDWLVDYPTMDDRLSNEALKSSDRLKQEVNKEQV